MRRRALLTGFAAVAALAAQTALGQEALQSEVVTIDPEQLFAGTAYGRRVLQMVEDRSSALATENRRIEAELIAEERALTDQRPTLSVEEFRALADAFDEKVQRLRAEQDAKTREIQSLRDREQQQFLNRVAPILSELVQERGALVVMDRRTVFISSARIDITDAAIARIDETLGDGE